MRKSVTIEVNVPTSRLALFKLNQMHGWEDGTMPLSARVTDEHLEATRALMRSSTVVLEMSFDAKGNKRFTVIESAEAKL